MKVKLLLTFALLLTAVTGAWADFTPQPGDVWDDATKTLTVNSNPGNDAYSENTEIKHLVIASGVTTIGNAAFDGTGLTTVTISASVTSIGSYAFARCSNLVTMTVEAGNTVYDSRNGCNAIIEKKSNTLIAGCNSSFIPDDVTAIGDVAFYYCTGLTSITIPSSVTSIGDYAFSGCAGLTTVTFATGSKLETIGEGAFNGTGLTSIEIPAGVTTIGEAAFQECSDLATVTFATGSKLETIDDVAFASTGLTSIEIPAGVTSIGDAAFQECSDLATVTFASGAKLETIGIEVFGSCKSLNSVTIPASVTSIGMNAFISCTGLTTVTFDSGSKLETIGEAAFDGTGLTSINIPASVTTIGNGAFTGCSQLVTMTVEAGNTVYDSRNGCNAIIEKKSNTLIAGCNSSFIPDDVTAIGDGAFFYCTGLTTVTIPASVTSIGNQAFYDCTDLTTVTIGSGVTYIGGDAFFNCTKVEVVYCNADPEKLEWEEDGCDDFKKDGFTIIHVADAAPWIANFTGVVNGTFIDKPYVPLTWNYDAGTKTLTFSGTVIPSYDDPDDRPWKDYVSEVEKIVISDGVMSIGSNAFGYCASLTTVTIPASVTGIGMFAFEDCYSLTTVTIPAGVTYIGNDAFYNCTAVTDVYCYADPAMLTWDESGCDDFKDDGTTVIHVANTDPWYTKFGSVVHGIFRDPSTVPLSWNYDAGTKTLTISGTEPILSYDDPDERPWNSYVSEIEKIVINDGVWGIGEKAFRDCSALTSVTIPNSVTSIRESAFENCLVLPSVTIPNSVKVIGEGAFAYCPKLSSFTIPSSVTSIEGNPFICDYKLTTLTVDAGNTAFKIVDGMLLTKDGEKIICCLYGKSSVTIPSSVTNIGRYAFADYSGLANIIIPSNVTSICNRAFCGCDGLTTVTIGSGVTLIDTDAFFNCTAVTDVYCYANPDYLYWYDSSCDDFMYDGSTKCHVTDATEFKEKWSTDDPDVDVNVKFVDDLAPEAVTNVAGEEYWSSYYNSAAHLMADDNTTVYKATLSGTTVTLTEISDKVITAGQAVLLKKTTTEPVVLTPCADSSEDDYSGNDLEGVDAETAKESGSDYYVLSYQNFKLSFYKYSGTTLGANKAFFKIPANSSREFLDILGEVTGIDGRYKMEDGRSDVYYDLNGRRVMNPTKKGVYIVNGNKVVIK